MNLKLTVAQLLGVLKRVGAVYLVSILTAVTATGFGWNLPALEKVGIASLLPAAALLQGIVSSWLSGVPQLLASLRLFLVGHSAPSAGLSYGKAPAKFTPGMWWLRDYLTDNLPAPPKSISWGQKVVNLGMMLNDRLGDCTIAGLGHAIQIWTSNLLHQFTVPDAIILATYSKLSGYDPATGANDNGCNELDVLEYWRINGVDGHKILAHMAVNTKDITRIKQAIDLLELVYIGTMVPAGWEQAPPIWNVLHGAGGKIVGGHCVIYVGYDATGFWLISWGGLYKITYAAHRKYVDEVHAIATPDQVDANGVSPTGLNGPKILADLQQLAA